VINAPQRPTEDEVHEYAETWRGKFYSPDNAGSFTQREGVFKPSLANDRVGYIYPVEANYYAFYDHPDLGVIILVDARTEADYE